MLKDKPHMGWTEHAKKIGKRGRRAQARLAGKASAARRSPEELRATGLALAEWGRNNPDLLLAKNRKAALTKVGMKYKKRLTAPKVAID